MIIACRQIPTPEELTGSADAWTRPDATDTIGTGTGARTSPPHLQPMPASLVGRDGPPSAKAQARV